LSAAPGQHAIWFYVPVEKDDGSDGWTGSITPPGAPGEFWTFEAVRHVDATALHHGAPFENGLVWAVLNHQEPCTLIVPALHGSRVDSRDYCCSVDTYDLVM